MNENNFKHVSKQRKKQITCLVNDKVTQALNLEGINVSALVNHLLTDYVEKTFKSTLDKVEKSEENLKNENHKKL